MPNPIPASGWYPGDNAPGVKVYSGPVLDAMTHGFQKGVASLAFSVTAPGTIVSGGTVRNSTGVDCTVYASSTLGIASAKVGTTSIPGSVSAGNTAQYLVPATSAIAVTYSGTLTWAWLPA